MPLPPHRFLEIDLVAAELDHDVTVHLDDDLLEDFSSGRRHPRRHNQHWEWQWMAFALINFTQRPPLRQVRKRYRRRFGIESSYRIMEDARVRTTSNNPAVRFVYMSVALLLQSLWLALHWAFLRVPGPGPRRVRAEALRFDRFKRFLIRAVEAIYGVVSALVPLLPVGISVKY